jgi:uncharacterized protein YndB with AHSA1/START domain
MMTTAPKPSASARVTLTRVFDAPRDVVWKAWTDPEYLAKWWGPKSFTNPVCEFDARRGGKIRIDMRAPNGTVYPMTGTVLEIAEPERLVFTSVAEDHDGNPLIEGHTTVTFEDQGEKTKVTVDASAVANVPIAAEMLKGMEAGWTQSLEKLDTLVSRR